MNCPKCGRVCPIDANFCARCGAKLEHENVTFDAEEPSQENDLRPLSANPVRLEKSKSDTAAPRTKRKPLFEDYEPVEEPVGEGKKEKEAASKVSDDGPTAIYKRPKALRQEAQKAADQPEADVDVFRDKPKAKKKPDDDFGWDDEDDDDFAEEEPRSHFSLFHRRKKNAPAKDEDFDDDDFDMDEDEDDRPAKKKSAPGRKPLPAPQKPVSHIRPVSQDKPMEDPVFLFEDEEEEEEEERTHSGAGLRILALLTLVALVVFGIYFFKYTETGRRWQAMWGISKDPADYMELGNYHMQRRDYSDAAKDYYAAFSNAYAAFDYDLADYQLCLNVGQGLVNATDYDRAVRLYKFIIDHWPQEKEPVERLLALYQTLGMNAEYEELMKQKGELVLPQAQEQAQAAPAAQETASGLAAPTATVPGGSYDSTVQIGLSAAPGAEIYYTLDGSKPDTSARKYEGFIILDQSTTYVVRAVAVKDGAVSPEMTETYQIQMK